MCVKEFYGYICGHCSVPYLRQCPLSSSNIMFPICKIPAERPIFTNEYCHPCSRVLWNIKVLKEEEEHRGQHQRGECTCEVIFDAEERERRLRPRSGKGKGRGRGREEAGGDCVGQGSGDYGRGDGECRRSRGGGMSSDRHVKEVSGTAFQTIENIAGSSSTRRAWAPEVKIAAYEYVGYVVGQGGQGHNENEGFVAPGGYVEQQSTGWAGQLMMGEVGSGMKWYPQEASPSLPPLPPLPRPLSRTYSRVPLVWPRAMSEPATRNEYQDSLTGEESGVEFGDAEIPQQPMTVSSDKGRDRS